MRGYLFPSLVITGMSELEFDVEGELSGRQYILALRLQNRKIHSIQEFHTVEGQEIRES